MSAGNVLDEFGLAEPLLVGAAFELNHGGQRIHLVRNAAREGIFGNLVHKFQKGSQPRFHKHGAAVRSQHALHFGKSLIEVVRQGGEMVQAALDDEDVLAAIGKGKFPAIRDRAFRRAFELRKEPGRQVHAFEPGEAETLQSDQPVSAPAKKFDDFGVAGPLRSAQAIEARDKLLNFLFRRFESQVGGFPGIQG